MIRTLGAGARLAAAAVLALSGGALAAAPALAAGSTASDAAWLVAAHQSNLAEIAAGKDAQENGTDDQVTMLGEMLVTDHTTLDSTVKKLATKYDVSLPSAPTASQQSALAQVKQNSGAAYDKAWVRAQTTGHLQTKAATARELATGSAADVTAAARTAAPVVQGHIDELSGIASDLGITVPTTVNGGTGGQAAEGGISVPAVVLTGAGLGLLGVAAVALRRRRSLVA